MQRTTIKIASLFLGIIGLSSTVLAQPPNTFTATGNMSVARAAHTATLLANGKVLIAGGVGAFDLYGVLQASAELFDPATGTFTSSGSMTTPRSAHTATLLADGRVFIAGGSHGRLGSTEIYDPSTGAFTPASDKMVPESDLVHRFINTQTY